MKKILTVVFIMLIISACATAPKHHEIDKSDTIDEPFDKVWGALIETFAELNLPIDTIEKDSGIIATDWLDYYGTNNKAYCDCGGLGLSIERERIGKFNVFVRELDPASTMITVNAKFEQTYEFMDSRFTRKCNSIGTIEKQIMDEVYIRCKKQ